MNGRILTLALAVVVVLMAVVTGCGGSKVVSHRLTPGQRIDFKPGAVEVGSPISCVKRFYHTVVRVPKRGHRMVGVSDFGPHSTQITLRTLPDGSVLAVCSYS